MVRAALLRRRRRNRSADAAQRPAGGIRCWRWERLDRVAALVVPFRREVYRAVAQSLRRSPTEIAKTTPCTVERGLKSSAIFSSDMGRVSRLLFSSSARPKTGRSRYVAIAVALDAVGERAVDGALFVGGLQAEAGTARDADGDRVPSDAIAELAHHLCARIGHDRGVVAAWKKPWP